MTFIPGRSSEASNYLAAAAAESRQAIAGTGVAFKNATGANFFRQLKLQRDSPSPPPFGLSEEFIGAETVPAVRLEHLNPGFHGLGPANFHTKSNPGAQGNRGNMQPAPGIPKDWDRAGYEPLMRNRTALIAASTVSSRDISRAEKRLDWRYDGCGTPRLVCNLCTRRWLITGATTGSRFESGSVHHLSSSVERAVGTTAPARRHAGASLKTTGRAPNPPSRQKRVNSRSHARPAQFPSAGV